VEITKRTIIAGIKTKLQEGKGKWPEYLDEVLWAYRTTPRMATGKSPYELAFGMDVVTPMELLNESLRVTNCDRELNEEEKVMALEEIDELRTNARLHNIEYKKRVRHAFDKRITPRQFQPGDLVLRKVEATGKKVLNWILHGKAHVESFNLMKSGIQIRGDGWYRGSVKGIASLHSFFPG
jgi:hypothetical protein